MATGCNPVSRSTDSSLVILGRIATGSTPAFVEALQVSNGRIVYTGNRSGLRLHRNTRILDLQGAFAFPGFSDAHTHLPLLGSMSRQLDLTSARSLSEFLTLLRTRVQQRPVGPIVGFGWNETLWPEHRLPSRDDLDRISPNRPILLSRIDGHAAIANSAALALASITSSSSDPPGGRIERDDVGSATGILIDNAINLVSAHFPPSTPSEVRASIRDAVQLYAERGWTSASNMSTSAEELCAFEALASQGELPLHIDTYLESAAADLAFERGPYEHSTGKVSVRGIKLYADGALGSRGAALLSPYSDAATSGLITTSPEELRRLMVRARTSGLQVATHAIGDRANRLILDLYEQIFADAPRQLRSARWRIEHAQILSAQDLPRFAQLGVIASMQPSHAVSDMYFALSRLGSRRLTGAYAWNSLLRTGAIIAAGSDAPVERGDPLIEFHAASTRHDIHGRAQPHWHLEQAVTRNQALSMLTFAPAFATFSEGSRGTLAVGKRADITAFSFDILRCSASDLVHARSVLTIANGAIVHNSI